jgi:hypothetical protein
MEILSPKVEWMNEDRIRVEIFCDSHYYGVMYYEKAKRGFNTKPIMGGWVCVDAKIQEALYKTYSNLEPKILLEWGMNQVRSLTVTKPYTIPSHNSELPLQGD